MNNQPELIIDDYGNKFWKLNGKFHREDGPAIEWINGTIEWGVNGKLYLTKEMWFQELTSEQQYNYLWSLNE